MTVLYKLADAAREVGQSVDTLRRAIHQPDPAGWPPPLRAKRGGTSRSAPILVEHDELVRWASAFPDA